MAEVDVDFALILGDVVELLWFPLKETRMAAVPGVDFSCNSIRPL
jgi:hypothetical protein